MRCWSE